MKTAACLFVLYTMSAAACADAPAGFVGEADCLVARPTFGAAETIRWKGACKDGYAAGAGVLERARPAVLLSSVVARYEVTMLRGRFDGDAVIKFDNGDRYKGQIRDGLREGMGYTEFANGAQYEGEYKNDKADGAGVALARDGTLYEGDWKDGRFDGTGSIKYALGGGYVGAWKAGKYHGKGVLTYAGSGRTREAQFENGRVRGAPPPAPMSADRYRMQIGIPATGRSLETPPVTGFVPFDKAYAELTAEQQAWIRQAYPALEEGDEPPYPLHGQQPIYDWIKQAQDRALVTGELRLDVLISKDGTPVSVKTIVTPNPEIAKFAKLVVGREKYKPALCHGAPCEMIFPFSMKFSLD